MDQEKKIKDKEKEKEEKNQQKYREWGKGYVLKYKMLQNVLMLCNYNNNSKKLIYVKNNIFGNISLLTKFYVPLKVVVGCRNKFHVFHAVISQI